ncbi:hypothetical protein FRB95_012645 [Tulasnella sp. JGI-2019a]|nr:hypothetical protein FRB95_012645 [Tulasnella sp. JGI-2019a]
MARRARVLFSYTKHGAPIQELFKNEHAWLETMDRTKKSQMTEVMGYWLYNQASPPAIFMVEKELYIPVKKDPEEANGPDMWRLSPFWRALVGTFGSSQNKAVVTCILGMDLNDAQLASLLPQHIFDGFPKELADKWRAMIMVSHPEERVAAFGTLGELSQVLEGGAGPQESVIHSVIGPSGCDIDKHSFTEDQVTMLKEVIFLHSKPDIPPPFPHINPKLV